MHSVTAPVPHSFPGMISAVTLTSLGGREDEAVAAERVMNCTGRALLPSACLPTGMRSIPAWHYLRQ